MVPSTTDAAPAKPSAARERLLETASRIFYAEGIHAVGVDRVIGEAHVTRATFYRHFPAKELCRFNGPFVETASKFGASTFKRTCCDVDVVSVMISLLQR